MNYIQVVIYEFLLNGSVVPLNYTVDLRASRIDKQMGNLRFAESLIELSQVLWSIIRLPVLDLQGVDSSESYIKISFIFALLSRL